MRKSVSAAAGAAVAAVLVAAGLLVAPSVAVGQTAEVGCADVGSTGEARALLRADPSLAPVLDADGDGRACGTWNYRTVPPVDLGYPVVATVAPTAQAVVDAITALSCSTYGEEDGAITDAVGRLPDDTAAATYGAIEDFRSTRLRQLNYCVPVDGGASPPGTSAPTPSASEVSAILDAISALDCTDYQAQQGAILDAQASLPLSISSADYGRISDALLARSTELNYCFPVVPTLDDGSVAAISGEQVSVVPEGSAETGGV